MKETSVVVETRKYDEKGLLIEIKTVRTVELEPDKKGGK